jgi:hypothetical protein
MSRDKQLHIEDPFHTILARYEISNTRILFVSVAVNIVLLIAVAGLIYHLNNQNNLISYLSANRIMYGFATKDGTFASVDARPESMVVRYAKEALYNSYNYDRQTIATNFNAVIAMYAHQVRADTEQKMEKLIAAIQRDDLSQNTSVLRYQIKEHPDRYEIDFDAIARQYILDAPIGKTDLLIRVILAKVPPTESRREGLAILSISDTPFVRQ